MSWSIFFSIGSFLCQWHIFVRLTNACFFLCGANQWTGFYIIKASIMKGLMWFCFTLFSFCFRIAFKVSEYPFKQNRSMLKNMTVLLYTYSFNISLNAQRPTFFGICNLPFLRSPNIGKIRVKVGPKTNYFFYFMSSCTDRIVVFNNFFSLIFSQPRDKQNRARDFLLFKYFLNNLLLTVFMQNTLSKLVELLQ